MVAPSGIRRPCSPARARRRASTAATSLHRGEPHAVPRSRCVRDRERRLQPRSAVHAAGAGDARSAPGKPLHAGDVRLLTPTGREVLARYLAGGRIAFSVDRAADIRQVLDFAGRHGVQPGDHRRRTGLAGGCAARAVEGAGRARPVAGPARHVRPARRLAGERGAAAARGRADHVHAFLPGRNQRAQGPPGRGHGGRTRPALGRGAGCLDGQAGGGVRPRRRSSAASRPGRLRTWCSGPATRWK